VHEVALADVLATSQTGPSEPSGLKAVVDQPARLHLGRAREELLAVAGRVVVSARCVTLVVTSRTAALWSRPWKALLRLEPIAAAL